MQERIKLCVAIGGTPEGTEMSMEDFKSLIHKHHVEYIERTMDSVVFEIVIPEYIVAVSIVASPNGNVKQPIVYQFNPALSEQEQALLYTTMAADHPVCYCELSKIEGAEAIYSKEDLQVWLKSINTPVENSTDGCDQPLKKTGNGYEGKGSMKDFLALMQKIAPMLPYGVFADISHKRDQAATIHLLDGIVVNEGQRLFFINLEDMGCGALIYNKETPEKYNYGKGYLLFHTAQERDYVYRQYTTEGGSYDPAFEAKLSNTQVPVALIKDAFRKCGMSSNNPYFWNVYHSVMEQLGKELKK